jgi:hypothetical protein
MPRAEILSKQAIHTLTQLHAELAGKIETNRKSGDKLRAQMVQVEAVIKMLAPDFNVARIAPKRRVVGNPWFKRGTMFRSAVDAMRRAGRPMTCREITDAVLEGKTPQPTRKQAIDVQAAILAALRKRDGTTVAGEGSPARWALKQQEMP